MTAHPATYTDTLLPVFARLLPAAARVVLDPFGGTGKLARLHAWRPDLVVCGAELEREWCAAANAAGCMTPICSAVRLPYPDQVFDAIITSPTYGNRMADHHQARERCQLCGGSGGVIGMTCPHCGGRGCNPGVRHTYAHTLGRDLHPENAGAMQWGAAYRALHLAAWAEARRVLRPGGLLVLNAKDHIRGGMLQKVTNWHAVTLLGLGFVCTARVRVTCRGQRHGANGQLRVAYESVLRFALASA